METFWSFSHHHNQEQASNRTFPIIYKIVFQAHDYKSNINYKCPFSVKNYIYQKLHAYLFCSSLVTLLTQLTLWSLKDILILSSNLIQERLFPSGTSLLFLAFSICPPVPFVAFGVPPHIFFCYKSCKAPSKKLNTCQRDTGSSGFLYYRSTINDGNLPSAFFPIQEHSLLQFLLGGKKAKRSSDIL